MFDGIKYQVALRRLLRERRRERKRLMAAIRNVELDKDEATAVRLRRDLYITIEESDRQVSELRASYLLEEADRLLVQPPSYEEGADWEEDPLTGMFRLTSFGQQKLLKDVRAERRERSERTFQWIAAATGVLGTLIGLVAIFKS